MRWLGAINFTWENLQIAKHKSGRRSFSSADWFVGPEPPHPQSLFLFPIVFGNNLPFHRVFLGHMCGAGVYPLRTGRIRCETRNNFTLTLVIFCDSPIYFFSIHSPFNLHSHPSNHFNSPPTPGSSPTISNSLPTLTQTLTKLSKRSAIDKRPGVSWILAVC